MPKSEEIPAYGSQGDALHSWLLEAIAEGAAWLGAQKPTKEWSGIMPVLGPEYGGADENVLVGQSNVGYNRVRRDYREIVATLSNFKHAGEFTPTEEDSQQFFDRAHMLSNLDEHWWRTTFAGDQIRAALQYAVGKGTAYIYQDWDSAKWGPGRGDIRMRAFDPSDVTFVQLPKSHEIQEAYVVLIRETLPLNLAKRMYSYNSAFANGLKADGEQKGAIQKGYERVAQFLSPALRAAGMIRKDNMACPTVDIWHAYTMDGSVNPHAHEVTMGVERTNWSYKVPYLGQPLPQGILNPRTGQQHTLPATPDDCIMFPLRRFTLFARTGVCYDGTSPWWHGQVPLTRLRFNDLPWEALGASQVGDAKTMQDGVIQVMRNVEDAIAAKFDPLILFDDTKVDEAWAKKLKPRAAGGRAAADLSGGVPINIPIPSQYYDIPNNVIGPGGYISQQEERIDFVTCARDLVAVAKARQIPSADTMEKLMEMAGPIVQDMVQSLVRPLTELGEWRKSMYFQFYTRNRMLRIADPQAVELLSNVRYTPDKIVPLVDKEDPDARVLRIRSFLHDFRYEVTKSGINELNRMSTKLLYLQLSKAGFPISPWTLAKIAEIPNFGPPPAGTNTEMERWTAWQYMQAELQTDLQTMMQQAQGAPGGPVSDEFLKKDDAGRPPEFKKPAKMVTKDNGARTTITTS